MKALSVHLFTATGAIFAMCAMQAAVDGAWRLMFFWLGVALIVDGLDGPLARGADVERNWPTLDGVIMDMIIDFLTYVFIPAYALLRSGLLDGWLGWAAVLVIVYGSVIYLVDTRMKTVDKSFAGFPACWNMAVLVLFAIEPAHVVTVVAVLGLTAAMFTNLKFIHPIRTRRWRAVSLPVTAAWMGFAAWAIWLEFDEGTLAHWGLLLTSLYLAFAGIMQQIIPARDTPAG